MAVCKLTDGCSFLDDHAAEMGTLTAVYRSTYCKDSYTECARWLVYCALGLSGVPEDLLPDDRLRALQLLRNSEAAQE